jgi:hypothetical protein
LKVLKFDAYFQDNGKRRKSKVFYYLEDDTMQVVEPKIENSGCYQGKLFVKLIIKSTATLLYMHIPA